MAGKTGDHTIEVLALVDVTKEAAGVGWVHTLGPQATAMGKVHIREALGHLDDVRVEVTEGGREDQRRAVLTDHRFHRLLHGHCLRHVFFFNHHHVRQRLDDGRGLGMRLVVAKIVAGADIDKAHHQRVIGGACDAEWHGGSNADQPGQFQECAAINIRHG